MDFNDTPEEARFRKEAANWLADNVPTDDAFRALAPLEQAKIWQKRKYDAGWACIGWAPGFGGRGASPIEEVIWRQEESEYELPSNFFLIGQGMIGPTLMAWASEEDKARLLPPLASGEEVWCQLFSEPSAGSDLGGIRLRATRDGEDWVLNGQKIWTSWAHISDFGVIITRTDPSVPKHRGMTYFFVDMKSPGVEVRPIKQAAGGGEFCEVFFTDVRIPDTARLGEVNGGWQVAIATLMEERFAVTEAAGGGASLEDTVRFLRSEFDDGESAMNDPRVRDKIADWYVAESGINNFYARLLTGLSQGQLPGPEAALSKLVIASKLQQQSSSLMDMCGPAGAVYPDHSVSRATDHRMAWLEAAGYRIAGGTDEILRNTIAERVLGLPGDIRVDKDVPFEKLA